MDGHKGATNPAEELITVAPIRFGHFIRCNDYRGNASKHAERAALRTLRIGKRRIKSCPHYRGKSPSSPGAAAVLGLLPPNALPKRGPTSSLRAAGRRSWIRPLPKSA